MQQAGETAEIDRLESLGAGDPGAPGVAALAEAHRRGGAPDKALAVAEAGLRSRPDLVAGRLARALALIDLTRLDEARGELVGILDAVPDHPVAQDLLEEVSPRPFGDLADGELEIALLEAQAEPEQMVDANDLAQAALRQVEESHADDLLASADSPFATETVARLLDEQGHGQRAQTVRQELSREAHDGSSRNLRVIATLERWLEKIQGDVR